MFVFWSRKKQNFVEHLQLKQTVALKMPTGYFYLLALLCTRSALLAAPQHIPSKQQCVQPVEGVGHEWKPVLAHKAGVGGDRM